MADATVQPPEAVQKPPEAVQKPPESEEDKTTSQTESAVVLPKVSDVSQKASDSPSSSDSEELDQPPPGPKPTNLDKPAEKKASLSASRQQSHEATVSVESEDEVVPKPPSQWTYKAIKKRIKKLEKPSLLHVCFFTINFVMFGLGMAGFSIGLLAINDRVALTGLISDDSSNNRLSGVDFGGFMEKVASIMVPVGLVFITLGLLGAAGVAAQNPRLLFGYAMFMGGLVAIEVLYVLYIMANWSSIEKEWVKDMKKSMKTDYDGKVNSTKFFSQALDMAQYFFGCCGITNIDDFITTPWYKTKNKKNILNSTSTPSPLADATTTEPLNNTRVNGNTTERTTQKTTTQKPQKIFRFPKSCCKSQDNILTDLTNLESVKLVNIDCPISNASARNPHTLDPCLGAVKKYLTSQVLVLVSLTFTLVGLQVSAVSNAQAMSDEIKEKLKKEKRERKEAEEDDEDEEEESAKSATSLKKKGGDAKSAKSPKSERSVDSGKSYAPKQEDSS